jgi:hypothetical protein
MAELRIRRDPHDLGCISLIVPERLGTENQAKTDEVNEILGWGEAAFDAEGRLVYLSDWTFPHSLPDKMGVLRDNPNLITERFMVPELGLFTALLVEVLQALQRELAIKGELIAAT